MNLLQKYLFLTCLITMTYGLVGCGEAPKPQSEPVKTAHDEHDYRKKDHDHSGWWCDEHGVPEDECSMCSSKVAKAAKAKGDWCDKHDRAKSRCFIRDPSLLEKSKVAYTAKYGKEIPTPKQNMPEKK